LDKVMLAQEEERQRIARELHDDTEQALASLLIGLRAIEDAPTLEAAHQQTQRLRGIVSQALEGLQRLMAGLRPRLLDELGLEAALRQLCEDFTQASGIRADLHAAVRRMPAAVETAIYRIVQEALTNVGKHAAATVVGVLVRPQTGRVRLVVEDNGRGFDVEQVRPAAGSADRLGLVGMQERTAILGGTLTIESSPKKGTTIYADIPLMS
jgi:signal transduction histidine kinase